MIAEHGIRSKPNMLNTDQPDCILKVFHARLYTVVRMLFGQGRMRGRFDSQYASLGRHGLQHVVWFESRGVP